MRLAISSSLHKRYYWKWPSRRSYSGAHSSYLMTGKGSSVDVCCYNPATSAHQKDTPRDMVRRGHKPHMNQQLNSLSHRRRRVNFIYWETGTDSICYKCANTNTILIVHMRLIYSCYINSASIDWEPGHEVKVTLSRQWGALRAE